MNKFLLSSLIAAAAAVPAFAGVNNINYQAVIKDAEGVVKDKQVELKFELLDNATVVYSEEQAPTTNAAGLVVCQLGGEDGLTEINWDNLTLKVSVNLGGGYQVISNEPVSSVPTALYALKCADSDMIIEEVEKLVQDNELNRLTFMGVNAELTKLNGVADDVDGMKQDFENLGENLDNLVNQMETKFEEIDGQLENLNMVAAVTRTNEETIGEIQGDFENMGENLTNTFTEVNTRLDGIDGQLENLNNVSAVARANEEAIEQLQGDFANMGENLTQALGEEFATNESLDAAFSMLEERLDKMQRLIDTLNAEIEELKGN